MIWYEDEDLKIEFDKNPSVTICYPMPCYDKLRKKEVIEKPFLNREDLKVKITYLDEEIPEINIPRGYTWDGATIPRVFWRLIGPSTSPEFLIPSMIHDVLCEHHEYIQYDRYLSTIILERLLYCSGVGSFKRWMMKHTVDNWQKIAGGWKCH